MHIPTASEKLQLGRMKTAGSTRRCGDDVEAGTGLTAKQGTNAEVVNMSHVPLLHDRSIFTPLFAFQQKIFF
jgi:hypothetical protein